MSQESRVTEGTLSNSRMSAIYAECVDDAEMLLADELRDLSIIFSRDGSFARTVYRAASKLHDGIVSPDVDLHEIEALDPEAFAAHVKQDSLTYFLYETTSMLPFLEQLRPQSEISEFDTFVLRNSLAEQGVNFG